ncbi:MAG: formylglycine-generating enzyme family protein, partial [Planctomycetota bacterium]
MFCKNLFCVISLAIFVFIANTAFCACPSADLSGDCFVGLEDCVMMANQWLNEYDFTDFADMASEWLVEGVPEDPNALVWVSINDSGDGMKDVSGNPISHGGFNGQMSKYKTTNAQYCQFLNAALASGDITVSSNIVYGANGSNGGADFVGEVYFDTFDADSYSQITYSGGVFSVRTRDANDMSDHPVVMVSWYGATAFCNYYGYRLPTEWEW